MSREDPTDLERRVRILEQKLRRSEAHRAQLEDERERADRMHRTIIAEMERTQAQLRRSEALARDANRSKSVFVANMSHEIRTPMNGVLGMAQLLLESQLTGEQMALATTLFQSAETLLGLLDDVLDFSKIEAGELELEEVSFDLHELIESAARLFCAPAHERHLELLCHVDASVPVRVDGDPQRIKQVLTNLLSNAVKFTEHGAVEIAAHADDDGVRITVTDSGIGISPDAQSHIFHSFRQADGSTTRRFGGSGLGLTISRQLVEHMNGSLTVRSVLGDGSTFTFRLPVAGTPLRTPTTPRGRAAVHLGHPRQAEIAAHYLEDAGYEIVRWPSASGLPDSGIDLALVDARTAKHLDANLEGMPSLVVAYPSHLAPTSDRVLVVGLPLQRRELSRALHHAQGHAPLPPTRRPLQRGFRETRVLVAEDSPVNRAVILRMLEVLGVDAVCVGDGASAVETWRKGSFDAILMDCQMPWMDGLQATSRIRALGGDLPIIALTASVMAGDRERCMAAGMTGFLSKPYTLEQVSEALHEAVED